MLKIGYDFAMRWIKGKRAFFVVSHIDLSHLHCVKGFHMSGKAPYGYKLEPTVMDGVLMVRDPEAAAVYT